MNIGFLGAGRMTETLAPLWVAAGHDVVVSGRSPEKAVALSARVGARAASLREATRADVVVLSVLYDGIASTLEAARATDGALRGKVLIDINNPVETETFQVVDAFAPTGLAEGSPPSSPSADGSTVMLESRCR